MTPRRRIGVLGTFSHEDVVRSELPDGDDVGGDLGEPVGRRLRPLRRAQHAQLLSHCAVRQLRRDAAPACRVRRRTTWRPISTSSWRARSRTSARPASRRAGASSIPSARSVSVRAVASQYETTFDTDAYGGVRAVGHGLHEQLALLRARWARSRPNRRTANSDTNVIAGIGGEWTSQRNTLFLDLTRSVEADLRGNCSRALSVASAD